MQVTKVLFEEHKHILDAIKVLTATGSELSKGNDSAVDDIPQLIEFIRRYADDYHHGKEEDILFVLLQKHGLPIESGPLSVLLADHDQGRVFVRNLAENTDKFLSSDKSGRQAIIDNARGYARLLLAHIDKEDNVLYPMADKILDDGERHKILQQFKAKEASIKKSKKDYEDMIVTLGQKWLSS